VKISYEVNRMDFRASKPNGIIFSRLWRIPIVIRVSYDDCFIWPKWAISS